MAQTYLTTQNGHRPQDPWCIVTPDYRKTSIRLLLNSGDNVDMLRGTGSAGHGAPDLHIAGYPGQGIPGLAGKPCDMPVAVMSSLSPGLAVEFTIHFLVRIRQVVSQTGSRQRSMEIMLAEPVRAILRNMLVVAAGLPPLLEAPLAPYHALTTPLLPIRFVSEINTNRISGNPGAPRPS